MRGDTEELYRAFAEREARGNSPIYQELAEGVAGEGQLRALLDGLPAVKRQPNLLFGAVRHLGGPVAEGWPAFRDWAAQRWAEVSATMLERRTQTNEAGRCATLLPLLAALPQPLALIEVGASAGLCLYPDRYRYRYLAGDQDGDGQGDGDGHERGAGAPVAEFGAAASPVTLDCVVSGPVPLPGSLRERLPEVVWRAGIDLNPLDVRAEEDMRWLESLVWPEQTHRLERLRGAVRVARAEPPLLVRGDLNATVGELVAQAPAGATPVVFHSAVLAYLPPEEREEFAATMRELPGHWISNEAVSVLPAVARHLPRPAAVAGLFALALDERPVAFTGPHGQSLDWFGEV
ncbi:DUF2332 domain-containing protein [Kitasatospora xanthocidica]|uniref:DUF2332 domain-containing protein n=1 Tax=Kitasatospora xanthocidica TaxID=83382 RepID=A0A372ZSV3_9ACTN|nr:DUF2332 domain-containing protein [Kitasatospora xanthocidica]RGD58861.1 DUF2332 domain-containing protein [Kitasatospora xanthocidica]